MLGGSNDIVLFRPNRKERVSCLMFYDSAPGSSYLLLPVPPGPYDIQFLELRWSQQSSMHREVRAWKSKIWYQMLEYSRARLPPDPNLIYSIWLEQATGTVYLPRSRFPQKTFFFLLSFFSSASLPPPFWSCKMQFIDEKNLVWTGKYTSLF